MTIRDDDLPPDLLRALRDPDVEVPGEVEALASVLRWMYTPPAALQYDEFIYDPSKFRSDT